MTQEALKLALEALKWCHGGEPCGTAEAIAVVEKALAQEQEPVAWKLPDKNVVFWEDTKEVDEYHGFKPTIPLYPHPQRTWAGLTEQERNDIEDYCEMMIGKPAFDAIEAKLKEKNT